MLTRKRKREIKEADGWKCINPTKKHHGMTYKVGKVNEDVLSFHPKGSCKPGGLYYTNIEHIFGFIEYAQKDGGLGSVHPIKLCGNSEVYKDPFDEKWKTNKFFLGEGFDLNALETYKTLIDLGADTQNALVWASSNGYTNIVRVLLKKGANIHAFNDYALCLASENGHIEVVRLLLEKGANIHAADDHALRMATENGHIEVVKFLTEKGSKI